MALFQSQVLQDYICRQDLQNRAVIKNQWEKYQAHFLNPAIQENIRGLKEEEYQEGFLDDLFVKILGYTKKPNENYNLLVECKNVKDAKKADGAIVIGDGDQQKIIGVIELKGTNTTDLTAVEKQAFAYKNNHPACVYVITANFEKLRFYLDNAVEFCEFNLFTLTESQFAELYLCLAFANIAADIPRKIKNESLNREDQITKKLYGDYSAFKRELYHDLCANNPQYDKILLFKKSQKLLDRILFILFAEDRHLLPPNSMLTILREWQQLKKLNAYQPLYVRIKQYFAYLNDGYKTDDYEVFAYNGGLFSADEILDGVKIGDDVLANHTEKLAQYDFASEVDVNILGHIFENSLNEIDEIKAEISGEKIAATQSKRKKDGVFYTPKYITKYIVDNTVGKICAEQKARLEIIDTDYEQKQKPAKRKILLAKLAEYRAWLLQITICDPACGSGAFLNAALDFLIAEHHYLDELEAKIENRALEFHEVEKKILENNLFGVDINEESVEIAKLSLWLRTAHPRRKLNDLNDNIKCGNSLISDKLIAGEKAFDWQVEFAHIFERGGFDVVIGNPPYVSTKNISEADKKNLNDVFGFADDLYYHFIVRGLSLVRANGVLSMITPDTYFTTLTKANLRKFLLEHTLCALVHLGHDVFEAAMVSTAIVVVQKKKFADEKLTVLDVRGKDDFADADIFTFSQQEYAHSINGSFFVPNAFNAKIHQRIARVHADLLANYWDKIITSRDIAKNEKFLNAYREKLNAGDWTLVGLVTEGGQGLATANNGKYVGVKSDSKEAARIRETRIKKLDEVNSRYKIHYVLPNDELRLWELFEQIKQTHGRDVFGQGYLYKIVPDAMLAEVDELTDAQKTNGIADGCAFVPYDKGDKDGNRWYLETPYLIDWSVENVTFLKTNSGKKGQGMPVVRNPQFYFREGFCYSDIKTLLIRCRLKGKSVHDVKSMSLFPLVEKLPYYYIISIINSRIIADMIYNFMNNTPSFQINDCRSLPIPVPTESQLAECKQLFDNAVTIQKDFFAGKITAAKRDVKLSVVQKSVDAFANQIFGIE